MFTIQKLRFIITTLLYGKEILVYEEIISVLRSNEQRKQMTKKKIFQKGLIVLKRLKK